MRFLATLVVTAMALLSLLLSPLLSAQNLSLTLSANPPRPGTISTARQDALTLSVLSGNRVSFARSSGRDYQLQASGGFFWTQVQELPMNADAVALTPVLQEDGSVEVAVEVSRKAGDRQQRYHSSLRALPGEWLQLFGPAATQPRGTRVYGTRQAAEDSLYLLVQP